MFKEVKPLAEGLRPVYSHLYTNVYISIIHKSQEIKQPKCPSTALCINKMQFIHRNEYLTIERNIVLLHAITYINLKKLLLVNRVS